MIDQTLKIAVSSCLLGHHVRYDGKHKRHDLVVEFICGSCQCIPLCPETAIGLGVPRSPFELELDKTGRVKVRDPAGDQSIVTRLGDFADSMIQTLSSVSGYIFKSNSPSCGLHSTVIYTGGRSNRVSGNGVFCNRILQLYPELPVIEETQLTNRSNIQAFLAAAVRYRQTFAIDRK